ncbi:MAG: tetratricopeptide repeat protein [Syntrophaceae bacterium]|nr:tetratricopeptide repeat protein [Syntrophaceae bacterium]
MARQNEHPVMHCGLLKAARLWVCAVLLVFFCSSPGALAAAVAPAADGAFSIHISSFRQEIHAIKHIRQLAAKGWPAYSRKVVLPRKGTWWRVYVGPYADEAAAGKQAIRLKEQGVSKYTAVERTGVSTAKSRTPPVAAKPPAPPPAERATPAPKPETSAKGKIFFPDVTSTEPVGPPKAAEAVRQPPAAEPVKSAKPAEPSPAVPCRNDVCKPKPGPAALPTWTEPPANASKAAQPAALSVRRAPASGEAKNGPVKKTGGITWGELQEEPDPEEAIRTAPPPVRPDPPAPAVEPPRVSPDTESAPRREPLTTAPALPGDRVEARKYFEKANEYLAKGMLEIAVANYSRSIELDPTFAEAYNGRGLTYEAIQRAELAISDYDAALRLKPDYSDAIYNRALACRKSGRFDQARRDLESACVLKNRRACELLSEMKGARK